MHTQRLRFTHTLLSPVGSLKRFGLLAPQMKSYPRDWLVPGRVRVKLRNDDGSPCNAEVPSRELMLYRQGVLLSSTIASHAPHSILRLQSNPHRCSHFPGTVRSRGSPEQPTDACTWQPCPLESHGTGSEL